jgi:hypothetical protein
MRRVRRDEEEKNKRKEARVDRESNKASDRAERHW